MSRSRRKSKGRRTRGDAQETTHMDDVSPPALPPPDAAGAPAPPAASPSSPPQITTRDVSSAPTTLDAADWAHRPWPAGAGERAAGFQVLFRRSALNAIYAHGRASAEVEVCGVLVGDVYRDDAGPFLLIDAAVRGDHAGSANAQVTFTAETWNHIQKVMEAEHPDRRIVGWYHTHPNFGIFLSDMDLFIHGNFFNMPWQVAFVYDPGSGDEGVFVWRDGKTERSAFSVEEDVEKEIPTVSVSPEITAAALADFSRRLQAIERRQRTARVLQALFLIIALAWPFILYTLERDQLSRLGRMAATTSPAPAPPPAGLTGLTAVPTPRARAVAGAVPPATAPTIVSPITAPFAAITATQPSATQPAPAPVAGDNGQPATQPSTQPSAPVPPRDDAAELPQVIRAGPAPGSTKVLERPEDGKPYAPPRRAPDTP